jgi:ketosteroid isomerase-like protein
MSTAAPDPDTLVARYYGRVDANDVDGILELFTSDAVYRRPGYPPMLGSAALEEFYRSQRVIRSGRHTITAVIRSGDAVAVQGTFAGLLNDGSTAELEFADFYRLKDGMFTERTTYFYVPLV